MRQPKYNLNQLVYYMMDNRVHSANITSVVVVENAHDDWACTDAQKQSWQPFGASGIRYASCHGLLEEEKLFLSKEELAASLIGEVIMVQNEHSRVQVVKGGKIVGSQG